MRWLAASLLCACSGPPADPPRTSPRDAAVPSPAPDAAAPPELTGVRLGTLRAEGDVTLPGPALQLQMVAHFDHPPSELVVSALCASGTRLLRTGGALLTPRAGPLTIRVSPPLAALPQRCELTLEAHSAPRSGRRPRPLGRWCHLPSGTRPGACPPRPWGERPPRAPPPLEVTDLVAWGGGNVAFTVTRWTSAPPPALELRVGPDRARAAPQTAEVGVGIRHQIRAPGAGDRPVSIVRVDTGEILASIAP